MACILCLGTKIENDNSIPIFSENGEALCVKDIILKHFWIEPKEDEERQCICRQCWTPLLEFHQFYLRIEEAHRALQESSNELVNIDPIASENDAAIKTRSQKSKQFVETKETQNAETPVIKKKRGRPKCLKAYDVLEEMPIDTDSVLPVEETLQIETLDGIEIFAADCKPDIDDTLKEEALASAPPKRKRGRPPLLHKKSSKSPKTTKKKKSENLAADTLIKSEVEFDELIDEDFDFQLAAAVEESQDSEEECERDATKKKYVERRNLSLEYDEYIAKNFKLSCCLCQLPMEDFTQLKNHFRVEHGMRGYVICCGKKLLKRGVLVDHLHTHQDPEYFKCIECGKVMSDRRCLEQHMKTHQAKGLPAFKCEICSKSFHRRTVYIRHVQNHMPEEKKKFECPECAKKFATHYFMNQHLKVVHLNSYSKICDICGKKIHGREALQRHQALHDSVPPPPIQCELCGLTLTTKYGLTRHMKSRHIADYQQPQVCPYCSKVSPNFFAQKRHIYYMHSIERRHACPMCEKAFKRTKDLREHMTTHTGDVLYTCPYCPKTFNSDANMYAHRKRVHRKEWEQKMREKFPLANIKGEETNSMLQKELEEQAIF